MEQPGLMDYLIPIDSNGFPPFFIYTFGMAQLLSSIALITIVVHCAWLVI